MFQNHDRHAVLIPTFRVLAIDPAGPSGPVPASAPRAAVTDVGRIRTSPGDPNGLPDPPNCLVPIGNGVAQLPDETQARGRMAPKETVSPYLELIVNRAPDAGSAAVTSGRLIDLARTQTSPGLWIFQIRAGAKSRRLVVRIRRAP